MLFVSKTVFKLKLCAGFNWGLQGVCKHKDLNLPYLGCITRVSWQCVMKLKMIDNKVQI